MLSNACRSCHIRDAEAIVGLIDLTVFSSAKEAVLFSVEGIHFLRNGIPFVLTYADLRTLEARAAHAPLLSKYVSTVCFQSSGRSLVIGIAGGPFRGDDLVTILREMKKVSW